MAIEAKIEGNKLIITCDLEEPVPSSSGKTLVKWNQQVDVWLMPISRNRGGYRRLFLRCYGKTKATTHRYRESWETAEAKRIYNHIYQWKAETCQATANHWRHRCGWVHPEECGPYLVASTRDVGVHGRLPVIVLRPVLFWQQDVIPYSARFRSFSWLLPASDGF